MEEDLKNMYQAEERFLSVFLVFCLLAILISCLGILGLSSYTAIKRSKEISIRKVLGASVQGIVILLSRDFVKLVLIALFIACPIGWYLMHNWLLDFAYRITISYWIFILAGVSSLLIAILTVSSQAFKVAIASPVRSLRSE
jgi:putative ABC transport system permease protein